MSKRSKPPFRADHVGSLIRPPELIAARADFAEGRIAQAELRAAEDKAVRRIVKLQEDIGLQSVTDGEFRRRTWHLDFFEGIGGIEKTPEKVTVQFHSEEGDLPVVNEAVRVVGKLDLGNVVFGDHFKYLKSVTTRATPKISIPAPSLLHRRGGHPIDARLYPDVEQFWRHLSDIYADEVEGLGKLGCKYLQFDDTSFACLCDPAQRPAGDDRIGGEQVHQTYIRLINEALRKKPADMAVCIHTCRGNYRSSWIASGGYDFVAESLFNELNVDGFFLEYDDERSGGFEPLRFVPKDKMVVLGLVTTKHARLESKDGLKRRVDEAARHIPLEQLCLSPQCGFSSIVESNAFSEDDELAKLRLIVETAQEIWG